MSMKQLIEPLHNDERIFYNQQRLVEQLLSQEQIRQSHSTRLPQVMSHMNRPMRNQGRGTVRSSRDLYVQVEKLKLIAAEQAQIISEQKEQLRIKSSAIQQQTKDIKKLDAELVWTRAALQQAETEKAEAQNDVDWQEKYARLQAETDNLRKRLESRASEKVREERNRVLMDMLPLADHLELALRHSESLDEASLTEPVASAKVNQESSATNFMDNIRATQSAFLSTLQRYNIEPIKSLGAPFDPKIHEAVGQTDLTDVLADHVAQVLQTGYRDGERLLRPARVIVSKG